MYPKYIYLILLFIVNFQLTAQRKLDFEKLTMDNGLSSSSANAIIQDRNGFIWIGTWNGLNRYDGKEVKIYQPIFRDSSSLLNREITALLEDNDGIIWIGTSLGLSSLDPITDHFVHYNFNYLVTAIYQDNEKQLWIGTEQNGLFHFNERTQEFDHFLDNETIYVFLEDSRKEFWIGTNNGLINFNRQSKRYQRYLKNPRNRSGFNEQYPVVEDMKESKDGYLWVACSNEGVFRLKFPVDMEKVKVTDYTPRESAGKRNHLLPNHLEFDCKGNLWVGTWGNGVYMYNESDLQTEHWLGQTTNYRYSITNPYSLGGDDYIKEIYADKHGQVWIATSIISINNIIANGITRYNTQSFDDNLLKNSRISTLAHQRDGELWAGTNDGILCYEYQNQVYRLKKSYTNQQLNRSTDRVPEGINSILFDANENLWMGTLNAGLLFHPKQSDGNYHSDRVISLNASTSPTIFTNSVNQVAASKLIANAAWLATNQGLIFCRYNGKGLEVKRILSLNENNKLSHQMIRTVAEDENGLVWIGTQNGLDCYDPTANTIENFQYSLTNLNSINNNIINTIYVDGDNKVWVGTNSGINKAVIKTDSLNNRSISFKAFNENSYLNSEIILNIVEDDQKKLWLGVYNGIIKFDLESEKVENELFVKEYRRVSIERLSCCKQIDGSFIFGGGNGFLSFHPKEIGVTNDIPEVQLTNLMIFNKTVSIGDTINKQLVLNKSITYTDTIVLNHKQKVFSLFFSVMDFSAPEECEFAYILEGFDEDWNYVNARRSATYTDIPPGTYTFKVKGCNSSGVWNNVPRSLKIIISPPWWKTIWAYLVYVVIILGLLYFFKEYSIVEATEKGRLIIEHMKVEEEHRMNELKSQFFTDVTHEFRTPLTLILGPAKELMNNSKLDAYSSKQADLIKRNAHKLLQLVNQLMEFRKVEKGKMELMPIESDIIVLTEGLYESFKPMAESKAIDFKIICKQAEIRISVDQEKYEKIIYNLVSNAFKYTEDGGQITVRVDVEEGTHENKVLIIQVSDTGIGIADEHKSRIFERFFQANQKRTQSTGGIGLYLTKALVELHGGTIEFESELGKGSLFKVRLPDNNENYRSSISFPTSNEETESLDKANQEVDSEVSSDGMIKNADANAPCILIAEDDIDLNDFLVTGLSPIFNVIATFNGRDALDQARKQHPDIILTDIMMPEMDGFELCKILRKDLSTSHIPVVFLTAKTMKEDEIKGLKLGAVDYVYKPFNLVSLRLKIQNILENRKHIHERMRANQLLEPEIIELSSLDEIFLKDAMNAVNKYLDDSTFDVEKFSQEIGISTNQAYRKIKALTGQTAKEFIRNQRLKIAASMLLQKKRSISEIIYMVGFSSPSYFTRCFKEYYDCTPKEYIENNSISEKDR
ncbi:MAG: two-component regulator propeller domain-containing protein [Prolixibacteraceae bacterium]